MTLGARGLCFVVAVSFVGCAVPLGMPPASSVARFVRTDWQPDAKPRGKVAATAAGTYIVGTQGGSYGQVFSPEAAVRFDVASVYELAPSVSTSLVGLDAQAVIVRNEQGSFGVLHGVGAGLAFQTATGTGGTSSPNILYTTFHAGLLGQLRAGPGTAYAAFRYAYGTGVPFGNASGGALSFTPSHYVMGNVGFLYKLGGALSISPELGVGWMKPVTSGTTTGSSETILFAPSVTVAADF